MNALRNTSLQALLIQRKGGEVVHLMPGRAITLADEELKSSQVQNLIARDLAKVSRVGAAPRPDTVRVQAVTPDAAAHSLSVESSNQPHVIPPGTAAPSLGVESPNEPHAAPADPAAHSLSVEASKKPQAKPKPPGGQ